MYSGHQVTREFERALCEYTGAPYAVSTTSCTMALLLALAWYKFKYGRRVVTIPKRTYVGVAASVLNAGHNLAFEEGDWRGSYTLHGTMVVDSARYFSADMYTGGFVCVSFHWSKILSLSQGGAVLHDDQEADAWMRRARFDGRTEGVDPLRDQVQFPSWHAYLSPEVAAHGLMKLSALPRFNAPLPNSDYPDLSTMEAFR